MRKTELSHPDSDTRSRYFNALSETLETDGVAINYFERDPGVSIGDCYHRHHEQEEVFIVLSGTATFDTEEGEISVTTGETIRFAPGEWQRGWNRGSERLQVLALGAPRDAGPTDLRRECPSCEQRTPVIVDESDTPVIFYCEECGTETGQYT
ncbi:cupin domain-containing protein [Haladaptatus sp. DYF46]|uniref:cupin domain-containing protein n=1 Tax=Haladaptatus sp. DYF46 TaxID=2886041 RepID=UPI001E631DF4|nr:cupin domain-containing protein [Haladaptatus sp. DYF46]